MSSTPDWKREYAAKQEPRADVNQLSAADLQAACDAWGWTPATGSGSMGLSSWLLKYKERFGQRGFTADEYADLLTRVRAKTGDQTDYATYYDALPTVVE